MRQDGRTSRHPDASADASRRVSFSIRSVQPIRPSWWRQVVAGDPKGCPPVRTAATQRLLTQQRAALPRKQFELRREKSIAAHRAGGFRLAHGVAKSIRSVSIAVIVDGRAIHGKGPSVDTNGQIAACAFHLKLALATGQLDFAINPFAEVSGLRLLGRAT